MLSRTISVSLTDFYCKLIKGEKKMKNNSVKTIVAIGIGAALFFVLGRFVAIPSPVPNTNISKIGRASCRERV